MIRKTTSLACLFLVLLQLLWLPACERRKPAADGQVIGVKDGDTIEILENGKAVTVRLGEVDSPEKNQDFGTQAKNFTSDMSFGKQVRLQRQDTDRYGRIVARVYLPDGRCLNEELVKEGFAWHYTAYSKDAKLANLQADAQAYRRGLWSMPNPVPPWDFRKNKRAGKLKEEPVTPRKPTTSTAAGSQVWICTSKTVKFYHVSPDCSRLQRCGSDIQQLTLRQAEAEGKTRRCSVCG